MISNKMKRYIVIILSVMILFNMVTVYADTINLESDTTVSFINSKIDAELQKVMDEVADDELISVWLWIESIDDTLVDQLMIKEKGMDVAVYEDEAKFNARRLPQIEKQVEAELGYEKAHAIISADEFMTASNMTLTDVVTNVQTGRTPVDEAVSEEFDEFVMAKRSIQKREQSARNQEFIDMHIKQFGEREIIYIGEYISAIVVKLTKSEIDYLADINEIKEIALYKEEIVEASFDIALEQVGIYCENGTGYDASDWVAHSGWGVKIGIIEARNAYYDSQAILLRNNNKLSVIYNDNPSYPESLEKLPYAAREHATLVTSIIAGRLTLINSKVYEGGAPSATVYQMPIYTSTDVVTGIEQLADLGVNVINASLGGGGNSVYTVYDKAIDKVLEKTGIVLVIAAGNDGMGNGSISDQAKALNAITVGNAATKIGLTTVTNPHYVHCTSSYYEELYLPNKPDLLAPGANLGIPTSENEILLGIGTSLSTPIVTSVIAHMMEENSQLKNNPLAVKAALLLSADHSRLDVTNDVWKSNGIRDKSGVGLVDARYALNRIIPSTKINIDLDIDSQSERYYFEAGVRVKAVMVFNKKNNILIAKQSDLDDLDLELRQDSTGMTYASSQCGVNNVEIIDTTINESGYYYFNVDSYRIVEEENKPDVAIAFRVFE